MTAEHASGSGIVAMDPILAFLLLTCAIVLIPYFIWRIPVVGRNVPLVVLQILFGIVLGPSVLGALFPEFTAPMLTPDTIKRIAAVGWLAVVFFVFLTGLHFDVADLRGQGRSFAWISVSSVMLPLAIGVPVGFWLFDVFPLLSGERATPLLFALGASIAMAVTALPVLAGILREMDMVRTRVGQLALGAAAVNDFLLWVLVAFLLLAMGGAMGEASPLSLMLGLGYLLVLIFVVRPWLPRLLARACADGKLGELDLVMILALCFGSAAITEATGLHYIVGGFVAGVILPKKIAGNILRNYEPFALLLLMPFFFVTTGLRLDLDAGGAIWLVFLIVTAVAVAGKLAGTVAPARLSGMSWRDSARLGTLMQCKGLMEVIVVTILMDAGIISIGFFSALVLMAIATTLLTKPMVRLFGVERSGAVSAA